MKRSLLMIGTAAVFAADVFSAEPQRLAYSLPQVIDATFSQSPELKSAELKAESAEDRARSERGAMVPRVGIEGSVRRVSEIPELSFPGGQKISLTDNESYSIGPAAQYTLFKGGADYNAWKAFQAQARSARQEEQVIRRQQRLAAQLAYFQAQLAAEQVRLLVESYKVIDQQHQDIKSRFNAGAAARIDLLSSHQQTLTRRRQLLDARANLAVALRELSRLTGLGGDTDPQLPMDGRTKMPLPKEVEDATLVLDIAQPSDTVKELSDLFNANFGENQPGIAFLTELAEASSRAAKSLQGSRWPELSVMGKISRDYPNGPIRESITQKTIGASLNFPLFTGGQLYYAASAQKKQAEAAVHDRDQAARDLLASWQKARDQVAALKAQQTLYQTTIRESEELAELQYQSYRAGRARYLDVEDANFKVLQAKNEAAETDVRMLVQLATLESLSDQSN